MTLEIRYVPREPGRPEPGGSAFEALEDGRVVAELRFGDYGRWILDAYVGGAAYLERLMMAAVDEARRRGVKICATTPELEAYLASDELRDVREPTGHRVTQMREREVDVPDLLREVIARLDFTLVDFEDDADGWYEEDAVGTATASAQLLTYGPVRVAYFPVEHVGWSAELPRDEARRIASGARTRFSVTERTTEPDPLGLVNEAEKFLDALVADGSVELRDGDEPRARHRQVFAMADRLAPHWKEWREEKRGQRPAVARVLGEWLVAQPEIEDVFVDDDDLLGELTQTLWRRA